MSASDYMFVNAPGAASYVSPQIGFQLGQGLEQLPDMYLKGDTQRRELAKRNAFPGGIPTDAQGNPDLNKIINTGTRIGGLDYLQNLLPFLLQSQIGREAAGVGQAADRSVYGNENPSTVGPSGPQAQPAPAPQQQGANPASVPGATGPANIKAGQPALSSAGADNKGSDTVRSIATESFGGRDVSQLIPRFAQVAGVQPDAPLTPQQAQQVRTLMSRTRTAMDTQGFTPTVGASTPGGGVSPSQSPVADVTGGGAPVNVNGGTSGAPAPGDTTGNAVPRPPMPTAPVPQPVMQQPNPMTAPQPGATGTIAQGLVPPGVEPRAFAQRLEKAASSLDNYAIRVGAVPGGAALALAAQKKAEGFRALAKQINDAIVTERTPTPTMREATASGMSPLGYQQAQERGKVTEQNRALTNEQKNAGSVGMNPLQFYTAQQRAAAEAENLKKTTAQKEAAGLGVDVVELERRKKEAEVSAQAKAPTEAMKNATAGGFASPREYQQAVQLDQKDVEEWVKRNPGIQSVGANAVEARQKAGMMKALTLQPGFYSGPLHEGVETFNQFRSVFGANPTLAMPQEAFNKMANDLLTQQVKAMGQSGVGRVLLAEVNAMRASLASLGITPASNRALAEMTARVSQVQIDLAKIAQANPRLPGQINSAYDKAAMTYLEQHPLFRPEEYTHPQLLTAPDAPPESANWTVPDARKWAASAGLKPGDPIRVNGQIQAVP